MSSLKNIIKEPSRIIKFLLDKTTALWGDKRFLEMRHLQNGLGRIDWENPKTYTEKCSWMKLHDRNPRYTMLVDKIEAKKYVEEKLGPGYTFPLLGTWEDPEDIDWDQLPERFVLKCNHNSGEGMLICKSNKNRDYVVGKNTHIKVKSREEAIANLKRALARDYFLTQREWPYKNVKRRVLAEQFMEQSDGSGLTDYKFFCFDGEPRYVWMGTNYTPTHFDIYSIEGEAGKPGWKNEHVAWGYDNAPEDVPPPPGFEQMVELARKLSAGLPHVRVDFYNIDGKIYVGEFTFYTWAGLIAPKPAEWNRKLGDLITLPCK